MNNDAALIKFSKEIFSAEAIKKASYALQEELSVNIDSDSSHYFCRISPKTKNMDGFCEKFQDEVTDYQLRLEIKTETEAIRNLIIANAFSQTGLIADD